jgi:hypothetical protein
MDLQEIASAALDSCSASVEPHPTRSRNMTPHQWSNNENFKRQRAELFSKMHPSEIHIRNGTLPAPGYDFDWSPESLALIPAQLGKSINFKIILHVGQLVTGKVLLKGVNVLTLSQPLTTGFVGMRTSKLRIQHFMLIRSRSLRRRI